MTFNSKIERLKTGFIRIKLDTRLLKEVGYLSPLFLDPQGLLFRHF
jgi:hypothetical protein